MPRLTRKLASSEGFYCCAAGHLADVATRLRSDTPGCAWLVSSGRGIRCPRTTVRLYDPFSTIEALFSLGGGAAAVEWLLPRIPPQGSTQGYYSQSTYRIPNQPRAR